MCIRDRSGSNQHSVSDKVIRGGVKVQKRDLETKDATPQGNAILENTEFIIKMCIRDSYNLDMIISLGYRIKSNIATNFRR